MSLFSIDSSLVRVLKTQVSRPVRECRWGSGLVPCQALIFALGEQIRPPLSGSPQIAQPEF